ncbi:MGH1-like glycoside hydrolase domain-containing protein [Streptomyces sp. RK9]|uniref:MGH1-like glycoside hydrolase domain-containing protein n=1 Tax=Streptomyces sp. RK9 TaxID=3239284 RepID=UPI00386D7583
MDRTTTTRAAIRPPAATTAGPSARRGAGPAPPPHPPRVPGAPPATPAALRERAVRVLRANWTGASTVPSRALYPHQWSWDSAFIAIGSRHLSPLRAQLELETLLAAQWADGRVPHIVFNPAVPLDAYFPSPDFWRSTTAGRAAGAPQAVQTSGIVQPPVHALAAWLVHLADPGLSRARSFLPRLHPRLAAWHRHLLRHRDLGGAGLAAVVHPWEQGMDNSPCWDGPLSRVPPARPHSYRRADLDHGSPQDRPTDLDYGRYVRLAAEYRDGGYGTGGYGTGGFGFAVEDPAFNALLIASEHALARITRELGAPATARHDRAERLTRVLVERLWDGEGGIFRCRDLLAGGPERGGAGSAGGGGALVDERGVTGLIPLVVPGLPRGVVDDLVRTARGPHFELGGRVRLVPSHDLLSPAFDPRRYWRGPAWFNTNWLLERGLRLHGAREHADALRAALLDTAVASDFAEYVDPYTGDGCGARGFSWSAALALDLGVAAEGDLDVGRDMGRDVSAGGSAGGSAGVTKSWSKTVSRDTTAGPGSDEGARND